MGRKRINGSNSNLYQRNELVSRRKKSNPEINYTLEELHDFSQDKFYFLSLILQNNWMKAIYMGKPDFDRKLHFIRTWYNTKSDSVKPEEKTSDPKQPTLF